MGEEPCGPDIEYYAMQSELARLTDENWKLRTIIKDMANAFFTLDIDRCQACSHGNALYPRPMDTIFGGECKFVTEMRELGIEVG